MDEERAVVAGRPHMPPGPGFLEIVSGPGPLNALYVSCNLIPRRSARCPDRRVIYANSWASGSVRAIGPPGFLQTPDATAVPSSPLSRHHLTLVAPYVDDHHQEDGVCAALSRRFLGEYSRCVAPRLTRHDI